MSKCGELIQVDRRAAQTGGITKGGDDRASRSIMRWCPESQSQTTMSHDGCTGGGECELGS
jgi:hypothetical protein